MLNWVDALIGGIILIGAIQGWRRGLISELMGAVALFAAIIAGFTYPGMWDERIQTWTHLGPGSAHVVGLVAYAGIVYGVVVLIGAVLDRIAKLPLIGTFNGALGAIVGIAKAGLFVWLILYIALFFPLTKDLRADLHRSQLAAIITQPNERLDGTVRAAIPWFGRPFASQLFSHHRI